MIKQPPNATLNTADFLAELKWNPQTATKLNHAMQQAQRAVDSDALAFTIKYTRQDSGVLRDSAILHTVIGSGEIIQMTPYAKFPYYGWGTVNLSKNPSARSRWFEAVKANHKDAILQHAQTVLNREIGG